MSREAARSRPARRYPSRRSAFRGFFSTKRSLRRQNAPAQRSIALHRSKGSKIEGGRVCVRTARRLRMPCGGACKRQAQHSWSARDRPAGWSASRFTCSPTDAARAALAASVHLDRVLPAAISGFAWSRVARPLDCLDHQCRRSAGPSEQVGPRNRPISRSSRASSTI